MAHLSKQNDALLKRIRRISGQVAAIERGFENGDDCAKILQLVAAARGAMNGLMDEIIEEHLLEHVVNPSLSDEQRREGAQEVLTAIRRYSK